MPEIPFFPLHDLIWTKIRIINNTSGENSIILLSVNKMNVFNERKKVTKDDFFFKHLNYIRTINL
jgi:hypothetical protein